MCKKIDTLKLRDIRKRLEGNISTSDLDNIYFELVKESVDLCSGIYSLISDYIGNVIVQKLMEKCSEAQKLQIIEIVGPHLASLGVHKNGTWAVQKIIDCAKTTPQIESIVKSLKSYVPALLLDQFGNYVIQCCLRLGDHRNQFIFDAMVIRCWDLGQGRFGSRAMKACLESQYTNKAQQKQVSLAIIKNCVQLSMNSNGSILVTWLLDSSQMPGRYRILASLIESHIAVLCCHKLASLTVFKIGWLIFNHSQSKNRNRCQRFNHQEYFLQQCESLLYFTRSGLWCSLDCQSNCLCYYQCRRKKFNHQKHKDTIGKYQA